MGGIEISGQVDRLAAVRSAMDPETQGGITAGAQRAVRMQVQASPGLGILDADGRTAAVDRGRTAEIIVSTPGPVVPA